MTSDTAVSASDPQTAAEIRKARREWEARNAVDAQLRAQAEADERWRGLAERATTCGEVRDARSRVSKHSCSRPHDHKADGLGHVCRCEAERFLEHYAPCAAGEVAAS